MSAATIDTPALREWLRAQGLSDGGRLECRPLSGGQSNPTFVLRAGGGQLVLRKQPSGPLLPSAHAIDREYRVMKALADTDVPVPRMLHYCEGSELLGTPFYVMEFLQGRVLMDQSLPGMHPDERRAIYR